MYKIENQRTIHHICRAPGQTSCRKRSYLQRKTGKFYRVHHHRPISSNLNNENDGYERPMFVFADLAVVNRFRHSMSMKTSRVVRLLHERNSSHNLNLMELSLVITGLDHENHCHKRIQADKIFECLSNSGPLLSVYCLSLVRQGSPL